MCLTLEVILTQLRHSHHNYPHHHPHCTHVYHQVTSQVLGEYMLSQTPVVSTMPLLSSGAEDVALGLSVLVSTMVTWTGVS